MPFMLQQHLIDPMLVLSLSFTCCGLFQICLFSDIRQSQCLGKKKTERLRIKMQAYQRLMIEGRATCSGYQDHAEELFSGGRGSRRERFCMRKAGSSKWYMFSSAVISPPAVGLLKQLCQSSFSFASSPYQSSGGVQEQLSIKLEVAHCRKTSGKPSLTLFSYCGFK